MHEVDERLVAVVVDPLADGAGWWRTELEALELRRFEEHGFVDGVDAHRSIYDPVLASSTFLAVGWAPTGAVLSVCRFMRTSPGLAVPLVEAVDAGLMELDHPEALAAARTVPGAAVEATIVTVPGGERPVDAPSPTAVCHGLFMGAAWVFGCRWILSAVDPGALARGHRNARAGHLIETVGSGRDTRGVVTSAIALRVDEVIDVLAADPDHPTTLAMGVGRRLVARHLAGPGVAPGVLDAAGAVAGPTDAAVS